jgi:hypothetical protein
MQTAENPQADAEIPSKLAETIAELAGHYRQHRLKHWNLALRQPGSDIRRFFTPFREWDAVLPVSTDITKTQEMLSRLDTLLRSKCLSPTDALPLLALAAKNRAELMSAKSDFYPVFFTLIALGLTVLVFGLNGQPAFVKYLAGIGAFAFVATGAYIRIATREQVAYLKELANISEHRMKYPD